MKKIGIVTLHGYFNYGNKLQTYALKSVLEDLGYSVSTTIINDDVNEKNRVSNKKELSYYIKKIPRKLINYILNIKTRKIKNTRTNYFKQFSNKYLNESFYSLNKKSDADEIQTYDFFITGSDQVWNPFYYRKLPIYFLTFVEKQKRLSYAPSISRNDIPIEYISDYKKWLNGISALSIREEAGAKIINDLIDIDVPVLVDPTMLLTRIQWLEISTRASNRPSSDYILTYFLGGPDEEIALEIRKLAKKKDMKIINLGDINEKMTYETGPSEFIDYIENANVFLTDSFHGVVFSIVLQTPFIVFKRKGSQPSMYSRIETLLKKFKMTDREFKEITEDIFSIDFSYTQNILENEYNKSIKYLKNKLENPEGQ